MESHFIGDNQVSPQDVRKAEKVINIHTRALCKVFIIGEAAGSGQHRRCGRVLVGNHNTIPTLQGLRKYHKGDIDSDAAKGPKLHPLIAANKTPNTALGNLVAKVQRW